MDDIMCDSIIYKMEYKTDDINLRGHNVHECKGCSVAINVPYRTFCDKCLELAIFLVREALTSYPKAAKQLIRTKQIFKMPPPDVGGMIPEVVFREKPESSNRYPTRLGLEHIRKEFENIEISIYKNKIRE